MNHAGEIRPLTRLVRPHVAIVTTVEPVHLAYFDDEAEIAEAKAEIFEGLEPGGTAVLNRDNRWFDLLAERARDRGARILSFGEHASADVRLERVTLAGGRVERQCGCRRRRGDLPARRAGRPSRAELARRARRRACGRCRPRAHHAGARPLPRAEGAWRADQACAPAGRVHADRRELQRQPDLDARGACACSARRGPRAGDGGSPCSATCSSSATTPKRCIAGFARPSKSAVPTSSSWPGR